MHQRPPGEVYNKDDNIVSVNTAGQPVQPAMAQTNGGGYHGDEVEAAAAQAWGDPEHLSGSHENHQQTDFLDDVFGSDEPDPAAAGMRAVSGGAAGTGARTDETAGLSSETTTTDITTTHHPSDMHRLQQDHATAGYRDGLTAAKAASIQAGFDEGYSLGAALGLAAGELLGLLEGMVAGIPVAEAQEMTELLARARRELAVTSMFAPAYFAPDGVWTYDVGGSTRGDGQELSQGLAAPSETIFDVARAHPLVKTWRGIVESQAQKYGVKLEDDDAGVLAALGMQRNEQDSESTTTGAAATIEATQATTSSRTAASSTAALDW